MKKEFSPNEKAQIALEAIRETKTTSQLSSEYEAHPIQVGLWKKTLQGRAAEIFSTKRDQKLKEQQELIDRLYQIIGQRDTELDWLEKKLHVDT